MTAFLFIVRWGILDSVSTCRRKICTQDCLQRRACNTCAINTHITVLSLTLGIHVRGKNKKNKLSYIGEKMYDNEVNFLIIILPMRLNTVDDLLVIQCFSI